MKKILSKITCLITGYKNKIVSGYDDGWTHRKISIFAIAILFPTTIGFLNGYLLTTEVLGESKNVGFIVALIIGTIIFFIERVIIMSKGSYFIGIFRFLLACVIATIGSFALKEVIFHKDIEKQLENTRTENADSLKRQIELKYALELRQCDSLIIKYQKEYEDWRTRAAKEAIGIGSGKKGIGKIVKFYTDQAEKVKANSLAPALTKKDSLLRKINEEVDQKQKEDAETDGILTRLKAFVLITMKDTLGKFIFSIFFLLFFLIEMMVFVLKACLQKSSLDFDEDEYQVIYQTNISNRKRQNV